jgi:DNA-binding NarL/FixJ family response regulator
MFPPPALPWRDGSGVGVENPVQRAGLLATLAGTEGIRPVGHADTIDEVREKVAELSPNVLLLDVAFRRSDESLIPELAEAHPGTRTLVLVDHSDDQCALRYFLAEKGRVTLSPEAVQILDDCCLVSLHASAYGCVSSDSEPDRIVKAIRVVASGRVAAAPWLGYLERAPREGRRGRRKERQPVTARELEVISLLGVKSRLQLGVEAVNRNLAVRRRPEPAAAVREPPNRDPG